MARCANGTRKNKTTGNCEKHSVKTRCKNGTRKNKVTGNCDPKPKPPSGKRMNAQAYVNRYLVNHPKYKKARKTNKKPLTPYSSQRHYHVEHSPSSVYHTPHIRSESPEFHTAPEPIVKIPRKLSFSNSL